MKILVIVSLIFRGLLWRRQNSTAGFFPPRLTRELSKFASQVIYSCTEDPNIICRIMLFHFNCITTVDCIGQGDKHTKIFFDWNLPPFWPNPSVTHLFWSVATPAFEHLIVIKSWHFQLNQSKKCLNLL